MKQNRKTKGKPDEDLSKAHDINHIVDEFSKHEIKMIRDYRAIGNELLQKRIRDVIAAATEGGAS